MTSLELRSSQGSAVIALFDNDAHKTVEHVLRLVRAGDFAVSAFYRAQRREHWAPGREFSVLQGGPTRQLPTVDHEPPTVPHGPGTVSLARTEPGTASAQLFVCFDKSAPALDAGAPAPMDGRGFAVFGRVVDGLDVLARIHALPTVLDAPHPLMRGQLLAEPVPFDLVEIS